MGLNEIGEFVSNGRVVGSAALLAGLLVARHFLRRRVLSLRELTSTERRQWLVRIRSTFAFAVVVGAVLIWAEPLRAFSLTLMAFAVALVIATKEFILCLGGAILRASAQSFKVGDRIEIKGVRGWVIDHGLLATTLLEIGPGQSSQIQTGRSIVVPNSQFLAEHVVNETFLDEYVFHLVQIPLRREDDWKSALEHLRRIAQEECAENVDPMKERVRRLAGEHGITLPPVEPRVAIRLPDPDRVDVVARVPVRAARRGRIEQRIQTRFLEEWPRG